MTPYSNLSGRSGIVGYDYDTTSIRVYFRTGSIYLYTVGSADASTITRMIQLAQQGSGLNSYIQQYAKYAYAKRLR